jgi:hypothetical protein
MPDEYLSVIGFAGTGWTGGDVATGIYGFFADKCFF